MAVKEEIRCAASRLNSNRELTVTFVQIGTDPEAKVFLHSLNHHLNAKYNIIDTLTSEEMHGMSFEDIVSHSIR